MLRGALATPTRSADAAGTIVVGTVLTLLAWTVAPVWLVVTLLFPPAVLAAPVALAPALVARGYYLRVVAGGIETGNADGAPPFVAWGRLYREGLKSALLTIGYLLPLAVALVAVGVAGAFLEAGFVDPEPLLEPVAADPSETSTAAGAIVGVLGGLTLLLTGVYLLVFAYVRPAALAAFAATGRLRDGFRPSLVADVAFTGDYAVAWSLAAVTLLTGYAIGAPFVPLIAGIVVVFVTRVVVHALYGRGAAATLREGTAGAEPTSTDAERADSGTPREGPNTGVVVRGLAEPPVDVQTGRSVPFASGRAEAGRDDPAGDVDDDPAGDVDDDPAGGTHGADGNSPDDPFRPAEPEPAPAAGEEPGESEHAEEPEVSRAFEWGPTAEDR